MGIERTKEQQIPASRSDAKNPRSRASESPHFSSEGSILTAEQKKRILQDRARVLAQGSPQENEQREMLRIVEFVIAQERYAVEATYIREVQREKQLTPLPCTPSFILGIMNLRGRILAVIDLRAFFDLPRVPLHRPDTVIVFRTETLEVGVLTNGVLGARSIPAQELSQAMAGRLGIRREYLRGIMEEHTVLLDVERILADKRMIVGGDEVEL